LHLFGTRACLFLILVTKWYNFIAPLAFIQKINSTTIFFLFLQDNNVPIQENEQETNNKNNETNENENKVTEIFNELNPEEEEDDTIIQCDLCPTPKIFKFDGVSRKTAESKLERHIQKFHPTESNHTNGGGGYGFEKLNFQPVCRHCGAKNPTARHNCYLTIVNK